jgi:chromosome segregation ATPase
MANAVLEKSKPGIDLAIKHAWSGHRLIATLSSECARLNGELVSTRERLANLTAAWERQNKERRSLEKKLATVQERLFVLEAVATPESPLHELKAIEEQYATEIWQAQCWDVPRFSQAVIALLRCAKIYQERIKRLEAALAALRESEADSGQ